MSSESTRSLSYRPDIEALRGLAVLLVVTFHAFPSIAPGGFAGVDIFFVISGYLITGIILNAQTVGQFSFFYFYSKRIRRLFPALLVVLSSAILFGWLVLFPDEFAQLGQHVIYSATFLLNFKFIDELGYFDVASHYKPLLHLWSLSVEEQFYLVWPVILILSLRLTIQPIWVLIFFALASFGAAVLLADKNLVHYHTFTRVWQLSAGAILAVTTQNRTLPSRPIIALLGALCIALYVIPDFTESESRSVLSVLPVLGASGVIFSNIRLRTYLGLGFLGKISYPLYLWHWLLISFVTIYLGGLPDRIDLINAIVISLVLAWLTYRYIEPIRYRKSSTTSYLLLSMIGLGALGFFIHKTGGLPERENLSYLEKHETEFRRTIAVDEECEKYVESLLGESRAFNYCRAKNLAEKNKSVIALIGDSHAHALFPGIEKIAEDYDYGIILLANSSCPPFIGFEWGKDKAEILSCKKRIEQILRVLKSEPRISRVFLATRGPVYIHGEIQSQFTQSSVEQSLATYVQPNLNYETLERGVSNLLSELNEMTNVERVLYLLENPELDFLPKEVIPRPFDLRKTKKRNWISSALYLQRMEMYRKIFSRFEGKNKLLLLDPYPVLCSVSKCLSFIDGEFAYADDDHLSVHGSHIVANYFAKEIFDD